MGGPPAWPSTPGLYAVHGTSLSDLYAVGDRGAILHSTDRGISWTRIASRSDLFFRGVWVGEAGVFAAANVLADGPPRAVIARFDSGTMRSAHQFGGVQLEAAWGMGTAIYAGGTQEVTTAGTTRQVGVIVRSIDGGQTWTGTALGTGEVVAIGGTGSTIYALARDGWLATSNDRGASYTFSRLPEGDEYEALDVAPGRLLAASSHQHIVRSTDGGATWTEVRASADGHVWSAGDHVLAFHNGSLAQSNDGGMTWVTQSTREIVHAVWGSREGLVAVGQGGLVITSRDGAVWERRDRGVVGALNDVWGSSDDDVYAVGLDGGRGGVIVHTTDGGTTFRFARQGWPELTGVWSDGPGLVVVVGDEGTILRSRDRGETWQPASSGTDQDLHAIGACDARVIYAVGDHGTIVHSRDGGTTWQPVALGGEPAARLTDVACVGGVVYAAGPVDVLRLDAGRAARFGDPSTAEQRERAWSQSVGKVLERDGEVWWLTKDRLRRSKDGSAWRSVRTGPLYAGWEAGDTLWLAGWSGAVVALDRAGREREQWTGVDSSFRAIWGSAGGKLWAVGGEGTLVRFAATRPGGRRTERPISSGSRMRRTASRA